MAGSFWAEDELKSLMMVPSFQEFCSWRSLGEAELGPATFAGKSMVPGPAVAPGSLLEMQSPKPSPQTYQIRIRPSSGPMYFEF